ncbi:UNVERIFIED_CONTAM: hypothetical protein RMT77_006408 [Armadillidium vulgare]
MWKNFTLIFYLLSTVSISFASNVSDGINENLKTSKKEKIIHLREKLRRQADRFESSNRIFPKVTMKKDFFTSKEEGRFLNLISLSKGKSVSQTDLLLTVLNKAVEDFCDILKEMSDKFENFVTEDEANLMAIKVGTEKLNEILREFAMLAMSQADTLVMTAMEATGGGGGSDGGAGEGDGGGLIPGLVPQGSGI